MERKVSVQFSGVGSDNLGRIDGAMRIKYLYVFSDPDKNISGKTSYKDLIGEQAYDKTIALNYMESNDYGSAAPVGLYNIQKLGGDYAIYRREYATYKRGSEEYTYVGDWKPVAVKIREAIFRDYNISNNRSYQYIVYPTNDSQKQSFANGDNSGSSYLYGSPVNIQWDSWSLIELVEYDTGIDAPLFRKGYKANLDNLWFFKYNLDTGSQNQNLSKSEIQTLGQFPRFSEGNLNYISGSVSCLLGSEIVPYSEDGGYVERLWKSYEHPLSTNDRVTMLEKWRALVKSKNPKLLRDTKGQSWIIQIVSSANTPYNFYKNQPDMISFEWRQVDSTENILIYGGADDIIRNKCNSIWNKK